MKKPNFLIIGAARSGSTSLVRALSLHSGLYIPKTDAEPKFFSREQEYAKGIDYYLQKYFSSSDGYAAIGEKSTEYMENLSVAGRIYEFNPEMRLICILRDPVERAISNYWWSVQNHVEDRPIDEALKHEWKKYLKHPIKKSRLFYSRPHAYIDRSIYYENLRPFYELFPGKIKCIIFEEFVKDDRRTVDDVWLFLGLSPQDRPYEMTKALRSVDRKVSLDPKIYQELKSFFLEKNTGLSELTQRDVWKFWGSPLGIVRARE